MARADLLVGAVLAVLGMVAVFAIIPGFAPTHAEYGPSPALFPTASAALIGLSGGGLALQALLRRRPPADAAPLGGRNWLHLGLMAVVLFAAIEAMDHVGFVPVAAALIALLMLYMGSRAWLAIAAAAVATPAVLYVIFTLGLHIPLP